MATHSHWKRRTGTLAALALAAGCASQRVNSWNNLAVSTQPESDRFRSLGFLEPLSGTWRSVAVSDAPSPPQVIEQSEQRGKEDFNLALLTGVEADEGSASVVFRALDGVIDQGGGLVWLAQDSKNYFLARFNPLEKNLRAFVVKDGKRQLLDSVDLALGDGWHLLAVTFDDERFTVSVDGAEQLLCLCDVDAVSGFDAGRIGLWTKADARTQFDDLTWRR